MESWTKEHEMRGNSLPLIVLFQDIKIGYIPPFYGIYKKIRLHYILQCPRCKDRLGPTTFSLYSEDRDRQVWRAGKIWQGCTKREGGQDPTTQYNHTVGQIRYNIETYFYFT